MQVFKIIVYIAVFFFIMLGSTSCKKDVLLTVGGDLRFSTDTVKFDTVFTATGSYTDYFKIYNKNSKRIKISEVKLGMGNNSPFRLNVDGQPGKSVKDIEIAPFDSIYVFADVKINPNNDSLPFIVEDKVLVTLNGNQKEIVLQAYGQNAHYIFDSVLTTQTWKNDLPYVIVNSCLVDSPETLTIEKGCRIYMHQGSGVIVKGTLLANGTKQDSIIFQGDRLENFYPYNKDNPGEWAGILFLSQSKNNRMNHCILKNGGNIFKINWIPAIGAAINVQPETNITTTPKLTIENSVINNSAGFGLLAFNSSVYMQNCLVHTCSQQNIALVNGGKYTIANNTIATYGGIDITHSQEPCVAITNYFDIDDVQFEHNNLDVQFNNNIVYGSLDDELFFNKKGSSTYNVDVKYCLLKLTTAMPSIVTKSNCIFNQDPLFKDTYNWNFHLKNTSPAKGQADPSSTLALDLDDVTRNNPTSIGCYEVQ